jgi:hypothetical protein
MKVMICIYLILVGVGALLAGLYCFRDWNLQRNRRHRL